jgi:hypothetical protein
MELKMTNIEQILMNAPLDTELYSPVYGVVKLACCGKDEYDDLRIKTYTADDGMFHWFNKCGQMNRNGECMLYPSRDVRSWDGWQKVLFKPGDIIAVDAYGTDTKRISLFVYADGDEAYNSLGRRLSVDISKARYATKSEAGFFNGTLEDNGYIWDECIKALVALDDLTRPIVEKMKTESRKSLVSSLQPFDKVLVRNSRYPGHLWRLGFFESVSADGMVCTVGNEYMYSQCVPFNDETMYLLGTSKDYDGKYGKCELR